MFKRDYRSFLLILLLMPLSMCIGQTEPSLEDLSADPSINRVDVLYFHETKRCQACVDMEKWAYETVYFEYRDAFERGMLTYYSGNIEDDASSEIVNICGACYTSLYVDTIYGGAHHILELKDIWLYSDNKEQFMDYVSLAIADALDTL